MQKLIEEDFAAAAVKLQCEVAAIKAVCQVEAPRGGFNPDGSPVTLFEGHKFSAFTRGQYDQSHPTISYAKYTRAHYGSTWEKEKIRLETAISLNREAAIKSASWGKFQIMGFNHALAGHPTLQGFVNAMFHSEGSQLRAFIDFLHNDGRRDKRQSARGPDMIEAIRARNWASFAYLYNGAGYAENRYDVKMAAAYQKFIGA